MKNFKKRNVAIVTGASEGMGFSIAKSLSLSGLKVLMISRSKKKLQKAVKLINLQGGDPSFLVGDVSNIKLPEKAITKAKNLGALSVLINNTGGPKMGSILSLNEKDWSDAIENNLMSVIRFTKLAIPLMKKNKSWQTFAPSSIKRTKGWPIPKALKKNEIFNIIKDFKNTAVRAKRIGFECLEIHMAHGYLLHQFLSPISNLRKDEFGNDLINRMSFSLKISKEVRKICTQNKIILIFDEVITGFRIKLGGAQEHLNVIPDLSIFAKGIASGFSLSCLVGKKKIMDFLAMNKVIHGGTYNSSVLNTVAALKTIEIIQEQKNSFYQRLDIMRQKLTNEFYKIAKKKHFNINIQGIGSIFHISFTKKTILNNHKDYLETDLNISQKFIRIMQDNKIRITGRGTWFISSAHTKADIKKTIKSFSKSLDQLNN